MISGRSFCGTVVYLAMLLGWPPSEGLHKVQARCSSSATLPCSLTVKTSSYRYAAWYKVNDGNKVGIIRKSKDGNVLRYDYRRAASLGDSEALVLPWVLPEDSGVYECMLGANIGQKNQMLSVHLNVSECATTAAPTPLLMNVTENPCLSGHSLIELLHQSAAVPAVCLGLLQGQEDTVRVKATPKGPEIGSASVSRLRIWRPTILFEH
ncbi:hypothetical protein GN956_G18312 [Arapaima gigas]